MSTRILKVIGLLLLGLFLLSACNRSFATVQGSGNLVTESRSVSDFERVSLRGFGDLVIVQSDEEALTVETDDNIMPYIISQVRGKTLILEYDMMPGQDGGIAPTQLKFTLKAKELTGLEIAGSGDVAIADLDTDRLEVDISGSGDINIDALLAKAVAVNISGTGDVAWAGAVPAQDISISGSGKYQAGDLRSEAVEIDIDGSGEATIWATETLDGHLKGSGLINCYGDPQTNVSISGSGEVKHLAQLGVSKVLVITKPYRPIASGFAVDQAI